MIDTLIHNLTDRLLNAFTQGEQQLFDKVINAIQETTNCRMCTLWVINDNTTGEEVRQSASLIARILEAGIEYPTNKPEDYAHDFGDSFIKEVLLRTEKEQKTFYYLSFEESKRIFKSIEALEKSEIKHIITIPIANQKEEAKYIALLTLNFANNDKPFFFYKYNKTNHKLFSTIRDVISSCFSRYMFYNKQNIMNDLVRNYQERGMKKNIEDIFYPILQTIFPKYCNYEGASFFMWDSYMNHFKLLSTTGIINITNKNDYQKIHYQVGEGLTGEVAMVKESKIYDNLDYDENSNPDYEHKFREKTCHLGKTMMIIPIFCPSKPDEVIGVLRFINKKNQVNPNVVDYFNDEDKEIIEYASKYLALIIDNYLGEEERNDFIAKLSHEFRSPTNFIHISSDRLLKNIENQEFIDHYLKSYLEDISYLSKLQLQQTNTNLYISKSRINIVRAHKYSPQLYLLKNIINQCITTIIPFARMEGVRLDNIKIDVNFPNWTLYIDNAAFTTVFYNLLTNAIKYRNPNNNFYIEIVGKETDDWLVISISDNGLGIEPANKEKIFFMGFRGNNVTKYNSDGFGIVLSVVKQIVEDFEGKISVANFQNPTMFEIKLPKKLFDDKYTKEIIWNSAK